MRRNTVYNQLILGLLVFLAFACSTEKEALLNKGYHNMTARYNGYYNARVIIDEALTAYRLDYQEDYTEILPLDLYPTEADAPNMFPEMEDAIERCFAWNAFKDAVMAKIANERLSSRGDDARTCTLKR